MVTTAETPALRSFDEFARQVESLATADDATPSAAPRWHGRRAATLARQAGACDQLVTAALLHDFAEIVSSTNGLETVRSTAESLALLFPEHVVGPVRLLPLIGAAADGGSPPGPTGHGLAMAQRLRQVVHKSRAEPCGPLLPIGSLLRIARRVSLDDQ